MRLYAGIYTWLLAALVSLHHGGPERVWLVVGMLGFALVGAMAQARMRAAPAVLFTGVLALAAGLGSRVLMGAAQDSVDPLMAMIERVSNGPPRLAGVAFDDRVRLSRSSKVPRTDQPVLELTGAVPEKLRTGVMDEFDGAVWVTSAALDQARPALPTGSTAAFDELFLEDFQGRLPAPASVAAVSGVPAAASGGRVMRAMARRGQSAHVSYALPDVSPDEPDPGPALRALPADLAAELKPLGDELLGAVPGPVGAEAERLARYFSGTFTYSLETDLSGPHPPLVLLIKEKRPAYCVYFASAMAALLRTRGVATRLVSGFATGDATRVNGRTLVTTADAHAWVEVYVPEAGRFVAYDPTPWQSRLEGEPRPGWLGKAWTAFTSALRRWYLSVGGSPGAATLAVLRSPWFVGTALLLAAYVFRGRFRLQRTARVAALVDARPPSLKEAHDRYLSLLASGAQLSPRPSDTDDDLLRRLHEARGEAPARAAATFIEAYREVRFGPPGAPAPGLAAPLDALERALKGAP
jgi:transglutaminase-like putative cysteine protease